MIEKTVSNMSYLGRRGIGWLLSEMLPRERE
jgi:hypothetical protein